MHKIYKIALVVMVLLNGTLLFVMFKKMPGRPDRPVEKSGSSVALSISMDLGLSESQQSVFFEMAENHRLELDQLEGNQKQLVRAYFDFLNQESPDWEEQKLILDQLKSIEAKKIALSYDHFDSLKKLCDDAQKVRFKRIMEDIMKILTDGRQSGPPPHRGMR